MQRKVLLSLACILQMLSSVQTFTEWDHNLQVCPTSPSDSVGKNVCNGCFALFCKAVL